MGFEWGEKKSRANLAKHGIDFHTASLAFDDPYALTNARRTAQRWRRPLYHAGAINTGAILFLVFTVRAEDSIRLISARAATGGERLIYEETK